MVIEVALEILSPDTKTVIHLPTWPGLVRAIADLLHQLILLQLMGAVEDRAIMMESHVTYAQEGQGEEMVHGEKPGMAREAAGDFHQVQLNWTPCYSAEEVVGESA